MRIYISHANAFPFREELYGPLLASGLARRHALVLPHAESDDPAGFPTREVLPGCDLVVAEVSLPATGVGIELGWADRCGVPIVAVHREGVRVSRSVRMLARDVLAYTDPSDLVRQLEALLA